ncbi:tyrosine-type recombinase/integrase [Xanthobacteraceae bacterium A53D]
MARHKLTEAKIKALDKPGIYGDGDGLWLRVQKTGSRNWIFIWRRGTDRHEMGLGGYGQGTAPVSLKLAREKAESIRDTLARGGDPRGPRAKPTTMTFGECADAVLALKEKDWKSPKHGAQWRMTLREYTKSLQPIAIDAVTVDDVVACLTPHWSERPETADRLRSRIAAVLDYGKARGLRSGDNPAAWVGNLDKLLPRRQKLTRGHHAALDYHAMPATMAALQKARGVGARAVEFAALTAGRSGEVRGATWDEINWSDALWIIPAHRMKAGAEHRVPLTARAIAVLRAQQSVAVSDLVFNGEKEGRPISDTGMSKALRAASGDKGATVHGLRSSFRDWAGDMTNTPREICEAALAHTLQGVEAAYRRKDALAKRRELMEAWARYCGCAQPEI